MSERFIEFNLAPISKLSELGKKLLLLSGVHLETKHKLK